MTFWRLGAAKPGLLLACALGLLVAAPAQAEQHTLYRYDALGRLVRAQDGDGKTVVYGYDRPGNRVRVSNSADGREITPQSFSASSNSHGYGGLSNPNAMRDAIFNLSASIHATNFDTDAWIMADLGAPKNIDHVDLAPPDDSPVTVTPHGASMLEGATLEFSQDATAWISAGAVSAVASGTYTTVSLGGVSARYVRVHKSGAWVALGDFRFYAESAGPNQPPLANDDAASVAARDSVDIYPLANDTDPDSDPRVINAVGTPPHGVAILQGNGTFVTYIARDPHAPPDFTGTDQFSYTITDGRGGSASANINVTVTPTVNHSPITTYCGWPATVDTPVDFDVTSCSSDADGDVLTVVSVFNGAHGSATQLASRRLRYTPDTGYTGSDLFRYVVSDGHGGQTFGEVTMLVSTAYSGANQPPVAVPDTASTTIDTSVTFDPRRNDRDLDGGALIITGVSTPTQGGSVSVALDGDSLTFTPAPGFSGVDTFSYTLSDSRDGLATASVTVTVLAAANRDPVAGADAVQTQTNTTLTFDPRLNDVDPDGDGLTITAVTQPTHGGVGIYISGALLTYSPTANFVGVDTFRYTIADGRGGMSSADVTVQVLGAVNHLPEPANDQIATPVNQAITFSPLVNDTDPDGDPLSVISIGQGDHGSVMKLGQTAVTQLTYTPNLGFEGEDSFLYMASDGHGMGFAPATVHVTVGGTGGSNHLPEPHADAYTIVAGMPTTLAVRANDSDPDGNALTITSVVSGAHGSVVINGGASVTYTPSSGYVGADAFSYWVSDGHGGAASATVTLTVSSSPSSGDPNDPPPTYTCWDGSIVANLANCPAQPPATYTCWNGQVVANLANCPAQPPVTYTCWNGQVVSNLANCPAPPAANQAPDAVADSATVAANTETGIDVIGNDYDADGDTLTVTGASQGGYGGTWVSGNTIFYSPHYGFSGNDHFTYIISDGRGGSATTSVSVYVAPDAPACGPGTAYECP